MDAAGAFSRTHLHTLVFSTCRVCSVWKSCASFCFICHPHPQPQWQPDDPLSPLTAHGCVMANAANFIYPHRSLSCSVSRTMRAWRLPLVGLMVRGLARRLHHCLLVFVTMVPVVIPPPYRWGESVVRASVPSTAQSAIWSQPVELASSTIQLYPATARTS